MQVAPSLLVQSQQYRTLNIYQDADGSAAYFAMNVQPRPCFTWEVIRDIIQFQKNFAANLANNQRFNLRDQSRGNVNSPESMVSFMLDRMTPPAFASDAYNALLDYARSGAAWTGSDAQLAAKASGLAHLIAGSGDYQLV